MRRLGWTPSIVPKGDDQNVYIVANDFSRQGRSYVETDVEAADLETTISGLACFDPQWPSLNLGVALF